MRKFITPILYIAFLFPLTAMAVGMEALLQANGILKEFDGTVDPARILLFVGGVVVFGCPMFWLANYALKKIEKTSGKVIFDHIRQSIFYYVLGACCLAIWIVGGFGTNENDGYLMIWISMSLVAIIVNYYFLSKNRNHVGESDKVKT